MQCLKSICYIFHNIGECCEQSLSCLLDLRKVPCNVSLCQYTVLVCLRCNRITGCQLHYLVSNVLRPGLVSNALLNRIPARIAFNALVSLRGSHSAVINADHNRTRMRLVIGEINIVSYNKGRSILLITDIREFNMIRIVQDNRIIAEPLLSASA